MTNGLFIANTNPIIIFIEIFSLCREGLTKHVYFWALCKDSNVKAGGPQVLFEACSKRWIRLLRFVVHHLPILCSATFVLFSIEKEMIKHWLPHTYSCLLQYFSERPKGNCICMKIITWQNNNIHRTVSLCTTESFSMVDTVMPT
jgi:hypothetical protein